MPDPKFEEIHVLVVVPKQVIPHGLQDTVKEHIRVEEWFPDKSFSFYPKSNKKRTLDNDEDIITKYFNMAGFPPLGHPMPDFTKIMERHAYTVIFDELMNAVRNCIVVEVADNRELADNRKGVYGTGITSCISLVVTGNPGIGKSRFYLYFMFRLLIEQQAKDVLSYFTIVLNCKTNYHKYDVSTHSFIQLNEKSVNKLK